MRPEHSFTEVTPAFDGWTGKATGWIRGMTWEADPAAVAVIEATRWRLIDAQAKPKSLLARIRIWIYLRRCERIIKRELRRQADA